MKPAMELRFGKSRKKVKKSLPWISQLITSEKDALDLLSDISVTTRIKGDSRCIYCKGRFNLCGRMKCPVAARAWAYVKTRDLMSENLEGASPPGVFVGRIGYPYVQAGPMVPPFSGDTSSLDTTEHWYGSSMNDIVNFRSKLIRGKFRVNVNKPHQGTKLLDQTRELTLSRAPVEVEVVFKKKPIQTIMLDSDVQPMGPSAPLKEFSIGNGKTCQRLEVAHLDTDLNAKEAIRYLYMNRVLGSQIVKAFSVGMFGVEKKRRLVPTRWSITAIDSTMGLYFIDRLRGNDWINEYRIYEVNYLHNRFVILMIPQFWSYELIEAWWPGSTWNPDGKKIGMCSDWEGPNGRKSYASIGGCYYAARCMVAEHLAKEGRQAATVIMRETKPSQIMPVGVWLVRECVRQALKIRPYRFSTGKEAFEHLSTRLEIPLQTWIETSGVLQDRRRQTRLEHWL
ncbi:MAG: hypothetical protein ACFFCQ_08680 [Promethearchaeota archaeon]